MSHAEWIGFVAGALVSISLLPQLIKSWRIKSTKDIANSWTLINLAGQALWVVYGVVISSHSLVIMSGLTFLFATSLLVLKIRYG